jgi:hypothetical protein
MKYPISNIFSRASTLVLCGLLCTTHQVWAASPISKIQIKSAASAGAPVTVTIFSGDDPALRCGMRLDFGNGDGRDIKINEDTKFPVSLDIIYPVAGNYVIKAEGRKITTHFPCIGRAELPIQVSKSQSDIAATSPAAIGIGASCPQTVAIKNSSGQDIQFGLRQLVVDSGGVVAAREQISKRIIDAQSKALDDANDAEEKTKSKQFADSLIKLRNQLPLCE